MVRKADRGMGVLLLLAWLLAPAPLPAQTATPSPDGTTLTWIRAEEVPTRAGTLLRRLEAFQLDPSVHSAIERIEHGLLQLTGDLDATLQRASAAVVHATPFVELEDLRRELVSGGAPLEGWEETVAGEARRVQEQLDELGQAERVWSATRDQPETIAAGEVVVRRVHASLEEIAATTATLQTWRARVLALNDRLVERGAAVDAALERLRAALLKEQRNLLVAGRTPFWERGFAARFRSELPRVPDEMRTYARATLEYLETDARPLVLQVLLAALLMFAFSRLATIERPYAVALLLTLLASPQIHPLAPQRFMQVLAIATLVPAARILMRATPYASGAAFASLFFLLLADRLVLALAALPAVTRVMTLITLAIGMGITAWFARRTQRLGASPWLSRSARCAVAGLALAFLAELGGWANLSTLLGRGLLAAITVAVYTYAAVLGLEPMLVHLLTSPTLRRSRLFDRQTERLQRSIGRFLRWLGVIFWLYLVLRAVGLQTTALEALRALLHAGISVGALSLSIGSVLAFVLTLVAAMLLARVVRGVLEEEVYPRTNLPRGVPYVLSTLVRYGVYSLGFVLALAAAGLQLGQLSILLGGLGVGVGLGLQDLVKNFAAGLTLLLERRVHVGDVVQLPSQQISGYVRTIGLRATLIRSWNGSEVLVPNADLTSGAITNWTLSDRLCRLEVPVGVAYGTDPERVIALLLEAARSIDQLLADPAPLAFFTGFGESSLDFVLQAWTAAGYDQARGLTSGLTLAVHRALRDAAIAIPFPQRDLHLASVSPEASAALARPEKPET